MTWKLGQSGNPTGRSSEKLFANAIRQAVSEDDQVAKKRKLRLIAEKVTALALKGEAWAVQMIADRLDGKPAQESTVTFEKRDATDWTREELVAFLSNVRDGGGGTAKTNGRDREPDSVH